MEESAELFTGILKSLRRCIRKGSTGECAIEFYTQKTRKTNIFMEREICSGERVLAVASKVVWPGSQAAHPGCPCFTHTLDGFRVANSVHSGFGYRLPGLSCCPSVLRWYRSSSPLFPSVPAFHGAACQSLAPVFG